MAKKETNIKNLKQCLIFALKNLKFNTMFLGDLLMTDNLPELRDIHLPEGVSFFPLAYGWWVILVVIIACLIMLYMIGFLRKKSKKLYALHLLRGIYCNNTLDSAVEMSKILRRICVYKYKDATVLYGKEWLNFLNSKSKQKLTGKPAELLINAPYIEEKKAPFSSKDVIALRLFCQAWIGDNL